MSWIRKADGGVDVDDDDDDDDDVDGDDDDDVVGGGGCTGTILVISVES